MKNITKAVIILTLFSCINRVLGFCFRIFLSYSVGESGVGIYQIAISLFSVLCTMVASGLPVIISRQTAIYETRGQRAKQNQLTTMGLTISLVMAILLIVATLALKNLFVCFKINNQAISLLYLMLPALIFSSTQNVFKGLMWGKKSFFEMSLIDLIEQVVRISLCIVLSLIIVKEALWCAGIALNVACFVSMVLSIVYYKKAKCKLEFCKSDFSYLFKCSTPITAMRIIGSLVQPVMAVVIPLRLASCGFSAEETMVLYGAAVGMVLPMLFLPSAFIGSLGLAIIPDISGAYANSQTGNLSKQIKSAFLFTTVISLLLVPIFSILGTPISKFLFNSTVAGTLLESSAWIMLPLGLSNLSSSILNAVKLEYKGFLNYGIGAVALVVCIIVLPQFLGINALIFGMGVCMSISAILNIRTLSKALNLKLKLTSMVIKLCLFLIPVSIIISNIYSIFKQHLPVSINIIICGVVSVACYFLLCSVFNIVDFSPITLRIKKLRHKKS